MKPNVKQLIERIQSELPRLGNKKPDLADVIDWLFMVNTIRNSKNILPIRIEIGSYSKSVLFVSYRQIYVWYLPEPIENQSDEMINFLLEI